MAGERRSAVASVVVRVQSAVSTELREAALVRWSPTSEAFVWRARRCIEALLYALLLEQGADVAAIAEQGKTADELLRHEKLKGLAWPREIRDHLESVRKYGNTASHFQADGAVSATTATIVATALHEVVRWYLTRASSLSADDEASLRGLRDEGHRVRSAAELALDGERQRVTLLEDAMRGRPPVASSDPVRAGVPWWALAAVGVVSAAGGFVFGRSHDAAPSVPAVYENDRVVTPVTKVSPPPERTVPVVPMAPVVDVPTAPAERVDASVDGRTTVTVVPPEVARWRVCPAAADRHCVEPDLVTTASYRHCVMRGRCTRPVCSTNEGSNWAQGDAGNAFPINCVSREQAEAFCAQRGGVLTSFEALNEVRARITRPKRTNEWTDRGVARLSSDVRLVARQASPSRAVSFRCMRP